MKKIIACALVLVMALAIPTAVLADTFLSSPGTHEAPKLDDAKVTPEAWDGEIIVTPFSEKDTLPAEELEKLMAAYDEIKGADAVTDLQKKLEEIAKDLGVSVDKLAVSTLFNIHATKEGLDSATLTLTSDKFENLVSLLHYNGEKWEIVDVKAEGKTITFTADDFSPYAAIVATDVIPDAPTTGEALPVGFIALAVLFGAAGVCCFVKSKANA